MILALTAAACVLGVNQPTPGTHPDLVHAFQETWTRAHTFAFPRAVVVRFEVTEHPRLSDAEIANIRRRIEGRPDHPDRKRLEVELRRRNAPDVSRWTLWYLDDHHWRCNLDEPYQALYVDTAENNDHRWTLSSTFAEVYDADLPPPPNRDVSLMKTDAIGEIRRFIYAGWGAYPVNEAAILSASNDIIRLRLPNDTQWRHDVEHAPDQSRLLCSRSVLEEATAFPTGSETTFLDWTFDEVLGHWRCARIEERNADGRLLRTRELVSVERIIDPDSMRSLLRTPVVSGRPAESDPIRGPLDSVTTLIDFRSGQEHIVNLTEAGTTQTPLPRGMLPPGRRFPWTIIGWSVAALLGAALVAIRVFTARK